MAKSKIIPEINEEVRARTVERCRKRNIVIPTFKQLKNPDSIPDKIKEKLSKIGLWDIDPLNLFRITWKNDLESRLFGDANYFEIPQEITGVKARIVGLVGKYFPTGSHKVGAAFGCLVPRLVSGEFDPTRNKAVWPSTGNYCRGGAFDSALLDCTAIAILPEEMSSERFTWLKEIGAEVIATPGCESNVKEIYDKCWELRNDPNNIIFNQFDEFGNPIFHYNVTAPALEDVFQMVKKPNSRFSAYVSATGSAGTIAAGDYLKKIHSGLLTVASEAQQCPTLMLNGFGGHRIEGIGDKHIPWIHNSRETDAVTAIDDEDCYRVMRLFNEEAGLAYLAENGIDEKTAKDLSLLGISGIGNLLSAIKTAKYFEMNEDDIIFTVFTDSMEMYSSRLTEAGEAGGTYNESKAASDHAACMLGQGMDWFKELGYYDRKAIHNLKYFTWVEQQGKTVDELNAQWSPDYWQEIFEDEIDYWDELIEDFNADVGIV
ncbi:pyridoxal-phosphate dependent enzyme [PVC group bacterium]|nr:pyridoxal-phosphate dependent enzyme [PVC group bacterium]